MKDAKLTTFSYNSEDEEEYYALLQRIKLGLDDQSLTSNDASDLLADLESGELLYDLEKNDQLTSLDRNSLLDRYDYDSEDKYDVVYDDYLPPKSNMWGSLRPKPPSEDIIVVSPAPELYNDPYEQYGVNNPNWYGNSPSSTPGYGPDDFIVETVNLDKNFFYQFFTSKPLILDTDVSTSTSVQLEVNGLRDYYPLKRGRGEQETLSNLPDYLVGQQILPNHILKKTGLLNEVNEEKNIEPEIINKSKFKRYNVPPEVRITSDISLPQYRSLDYVAPQQAEGEKRSFDGDENNEASEGL